MSSEMRAVKKPDHWDVIIIGGGPAGSAAAITLAEYGWRVLLVEKYSQVDFKLGESLPPVSITLVEHFIGSIRDDSLTGRGISKSMGNLSCWQDHQPQVSDFFFSPPGFGLRLDRANFDKTLRKQASISGAVVIEDIQFRRSTHNGNQWLLDLSDEKGCTTHSTSYVLDCSGRTARFATSTGAVRQQEDSLFAFALKYKTSDQGDLDSLTHLEAGPSGWWYSARLPDNKKNERLVVFHTDKDLPAAKTASTIDGFSSLLDDSHHITSLLKQYNYQPIETIRGAPASSSRLNRFSGNSWLAAGDAAQSFDPLSSQGIYTALRSGSSAGQAINLALKGLSNSLEFYASEQEQQWQQYLKQYRYYYQSQPRWPDEIFWRRRNTTSKKANPGINLAKEAS